MFKSTGKAGRKFILQMYTIRLTNQGATLVSGCRRYFSMILFQVCFTSFFTFAKNLPRAITYGP